MTVVVLKLITLVLQCSDAAKSADGMANSVEPDQTAPSGAVLSGSTPFAIIQLSQYLEFYGSWNHQLSCLFIKILVYFLKSLRPNQGVNNACRYF